MRERERERERESAIIIEERRDGEPRDKKQRENNLVENIEE